MSRVWAKKRFWKAAAAEAARSGDGGDAFAVTLDGRPVRTPAGAPFLAPTLALAEAAAAEWDAQDGEIDPRAMPVTRAVNVAIDRVAEGHADVAEAVAAYGGADLLCYRADAPAELAARQAAGWDPLLDWAGDRHAAPLARATGVMHVAQPARSLAALAAAVAAHDAFALTALHELTALSGSLVLALAVSGGRLSADEAWRLSRIDEDFQIERWGADEEAAAAAARARGDFLAAARFLDLLERGARP